MDNCSNIDSKKLNKYFSISEIRNTLIPEKLNEFLLRKNNSNDILLFQMLQGVGKTVTTLKIINDFCKKHNKTFVYLTENHELLHNIFNENEEIKKYLIKIIKGKAAKQNIEDEDIEYVDYITGETKIIKPKLMCRNPHLKELMDSNISFDRFFCHGDKACCDLRKSCVYLKQFEELKNCHQSIAMTYQQLNIDFLKSYHYDYLIIDENPLLSLIQSLTFNSKHLNDFIDIIKKDDFVFWYKSVKDVPIISVRKGKRYERKRKIDLERLQNCRTILEFSAKALIDVLTKKLRKKDCIDRTLEDKSFIDAFFEFVDFPLRISKVIHTEDMNHFRRFYYNYIINEFKRNNLPKNFKNIFEEVLLIIERCIKYRDEKDCNTLISCKRHDKIKNEITVKKFDKENLPKKPIIWMDATADVNVISSIYRNRNVELFNPNIYVKRNIKQIIYSKNSVKGRYPKQSFFHERTRLKLYTFIFRVVKNSDKKVYIITHKSFSTIKALKKEKYKGMELERFLLKNGLSKDKFEIVWFEKMKGLNIPELKDIYKKSIILGTPEPRFIDFRFDVSALYEGEKKITYGRKKDKTYEDDRYQAHIDSIQKYTIQHVIERIRFVEEDEDKEVIFVSSLPIDFETEKMTMDELLEMKGLKGLSKSYTHKPEYKVLKKLDGIDGEIQSTIFYRKIEYLKDVKPKEVIEYLIKIKCIEVRKEVKVYTKTKKEIKFYKITDLGKKWIENVERNILEI